MFVLIRDSFIFSQTWKHDDLRAKPYFLIKLTKAGEILEIDILHIVKYSTALLIHFRIQNMLPKGPGIWKHNAKNTKPMKSFKNVLPFRIVILACLFVGTTEKLFLS